MNLKKAFPLLVLSFFLILFSSFQKQKEFLEISKFVDGDTFWVKHANGSEEKIRLIGVNTPEARKTGRTQVEYFGKEASAYVKNFLTGKKVRLEYDVQRLDRYKRTLAYIYLEDGTFLNAHLVEKGYATWRRIHRMSSMRQRFRNWKEKPDLGKKVSGQRSR